MVDDVSLLLVFLSAAVTSWLTVGGIRRLALHYDVVAYPNERSSHRVPVPLCGGIALVAINLGAWAVYGLVSSRLPAQHVIAYIVGGLLVASISLIDDLRHVPYPIRFGFQGLTGLILTFGYSYWHAVTLPAVGTVNLGPAGILLSLLWVVGMINAFNFIDGIDGMAGGQAVASGLGWAAVAAIMGRPHLLVLGAVLAATSLGFLKHNWHPARVFMGDVGATFLGYSFAALALIESADARIPLVGALLVWPVIFDSGFTVVRRLRNGENIFVPHRSFLFHRLIAAGWTHAQAAALYFVLPVLGALLALTWAEGNIVLHGSVTLVLGSACASLWLLVRGQEHRANVTNVRADALFDGRRMAEAEMRVTGVPPGLSVYPSSGLDSLGSSVKVEEMRDEESVHVPGAHGRSSRGAGPA